MRQASAADIKELPVLSVMFLDPWWHTALTFMHLVDFELKFDDLIEDHVLQVARGFAGLRNVDNLKVEFRKSEMGKTGALWLGTSLGKLKVPLQQK